MQQFYRRGESYDETVTQRRQDKIDAAKMAFSASAGSYRAYPSKMGFEQKAEKQQEERKHRYGLWRFWATVMLFFAFLAGTYFDFSFHGWNRNSLEKMLSDDTRWRKIVREVSNVMEHIPD